MLGQRVITALLLLPIVLGPILFLDTGWVYLVFSLIGLLGAWEWTALMGLASKPARVGYVLLVAAALAASWFAAAQGLGLWILLAGVLWWLRAIDLVRGFPLNLQQRPWSTAALGLTGLLMLVPAMLGIALLHGHGGGHDYRRMFFLFGLVWMADIGAYFAGRAFGRRKLAPNVSPGKTIEGAIGGFLGAMLVLIAAPWVFGAGRFDWLSLVGLSVVVIAASVLGDLTESLFKRQRGVKDSGWILPGHGGVLDRVDSLLAAAPTLALGLLLLGV